jgi:hypothetical protein
LSSSPDESQFYQSAINQFVRGFDRTTVLNSLVSQGVSQDRATYIVDSAQREVQSSRTTALRKRAMRRVKTGLGLIAVGIIITIASVLASAYTGTTLLVWGPILYGLYALITGLIGLSKAKPRV